eukprot:scaffold17630_cov47-Prasinocladus_malaysianus.AAC.1
MADMSLAAIRTARARGPVLQLERSRIKQAPRLAVSRRVVVRAEVPRAGRDVGETSESASPKVAGSANSPADAYAPEADAVKEELLGMRERLLADPSFPVKMGIECGIGIFTKMTAEKAKREDNFMKEIDFVAANVLMAIFADFMLTWLPAPTMSFMRGTPSKGVFSKMFAGCPDNAFQKVLPGAIPYTFGQRVGAVVRNGGKLLAVSASQMGYRRSGQPWIPHGQRQMARRIWQKPAWPMASTWQYQATYATRLWQARHPIVRSWLESGAHLSQLCGLKSCASCGFAGVIEERGIETVFRGKPGVCHACSFVVRTLNTFLGSLLWVDFVRLCGMQKAPEKASA